MFLTLLQAYIIVGLLIALILWKVTFEEDFDHYFEFTFDEEPPTKKQKWFMIATTPFIWPMVLWNMFT
jgi:hypothetical protein